MKGFLNAGSGNGEGKAGFMDALETLVENLKKECYAKFASRDTQDNVLKRLNKLEDDF
jgi:predicted ATPase